jgi:hypothetical protein
MVCDVDKTYQRAQFLPTVSMNDSSYIIVRICVILNLSPKDKIRQ